MRPNKMNNKYDFLYETNLLVLMKRIIRIEGKRYLKIVAMDYITGEIGYIVDNNGIPSEGLHSFNKDINKVKEMHVIRAKFETRLDAGFERNQILYKIVSPFEILPGKADLCEFIKKKYLLLIEKMLTTEPDSDAAEDRDPSEHWVYELMHPEHAYLAGSNSSGSQFGKQNVFSLLNLSGQVLNQAADHRYQEMVDGQNILVLRDETIQRHDKEGWLFQGVALVVYEGGRQYFIDRLYGSFVENNSLIKSPLSFGEVMDIPALTEEIGRVPKPDFEEILYDFSENFGDDFANYLVTEGYLITGDEAAILTDSSGSPPDIGDVVEHYYDEGMIADAASDAYESMMEEYQLHIEHLKKQYPVYIVTDQNANDFATNYRLVTEKPKDANEHSSVYALADDDEFMPL